MKKEELLRTYVQYILTEDDGGGDGGYGGYGGDWGGYGGGSGGYSSGNYGYGVSDDFFKDIWDAFVDPLKTTAAFAERFSSKIQAIAGKIAESIMSVAIPGYEADYEKYEQEEQERLSAIHTKYKEVFARTESHLFTGDAALMAFLYAPHEYITTRLMKNTPDVALDVIEVMGGQNPEVTGFVKRARDFTKRFKHVGRMRGGPTSPNPIPIESVQNKDEDIILEGIWDKIKSFFSDEKVKTAIEQSPMAKSMEKDAESYLRDYINGFVGMTKQHLDLENSEKLDQMTNGKFSKLLGHAGEEEKKRAAKLAVVGTKKAIKKKAIEKLKKKIEQLPDGNSHPLSKVYQAGISQIKSL